jgi:hypothetical protein
MRQLFCIKSILLLLFFTACSVKEPTAKEYEAKVKTLSTMLLNTSKDIDKKEAEDLARSAIAYAQKLAHDYAVISPPLWQNTLVNLGVKKRGLCYEWANDLWVYLKAKNYKSLRLHYVGADVGHYFEHNALSVSAKEEDVNNSIILDAWRNSGNLYFIEIYNDKKYDWQERLD